MDAYMPNLRIPSQLTQFFQIKDPEAHSDYWEFPNNEDCGTASNHDGDDEYYSSSECEDTHSDTEVNKPKQQPPQALRASSMPPGFLALNNLFKSVPFSLKPPGTNTDSDSDSDSSEDELERIGRFPFYSRRRRSAPAPAFARAASAGVAASRKPHASPDPTSTITNNTPSPPSSETQDADNDDDDDKEEWAFRRYIKQFNESWDAMRTAGVSDTVDAIKTVQSLNSLSSFDWQLPSSSSNGGEPSGITPAIQPSVCPPVGLAHLPTSSRFLRSLPSLDLFFGSRESASTSNENCDSQPKEKSKKSGIRKKKRRRHHHHDHIQLPIASPTPTAPHELFDENAVRQQIREIQKLNLTDKSRDRRIQRLMTANYYRTTHTPIPESDEDDDDKEKSSEEEYGESESESESDEDMPTSSANLHVTDADRVPTFCPEREDLGDELFLGCEHYQRGCKVECSTCKKWYTCRLCHDAQESHKLIRPETKHMLCMHCGLAQAAAQDCAGCGETLARYYCSKCKLWDDECGKAIYHCDDCGLCRIGEGLGKDFFHCKTCNVCMSIALQDQHRCIEHSTECGCPICGEYMFTSTETVVFMLCGHSIHQKCYQEYTRTSYKCPTCSRSVVNMATQFRILDNEIENQPMPPPYDAWRSIIVCNDCQAKSNVAFHFLGLKCANCGSYNTSQHKQIKPEGSDGDTTDTQSEVSDAPEAGQEEEEAPPNTFAFPTYMDSDEESAAARLRHIQADRRRRAHASSVSTVTSTRLRSRASTVSGIDGNDDEDDDDECEDFFHDVDDGEGYCELAPQVGLLRFNGARE